MNLKLAQATLLAFLLITTAQPLGATEPAVISPQKTAQNYITDFRHGETFSSHDSVAALIRNQRVDGASLSLLTKALTNENTEVRLNIVRLLETLGLQMDAPGPDKFPIIRSHQVIQALLTAGFARDDEARSLAATILTDRCTPADLAAFDRLYIDSLRKAKGQYLYIAAKAKIREARPFVEKMARLMEWHERPEKYQAIQLALAALGNTGVEDGFLNAVSEAERFAPPAPKNRFYNVGQAKDGTELGKKLNLLGLIGTRRSLLVVCGYLRSPLKSYVPNVSEKSVRYAAVNALLYNYPDKRVLDAPHTLAEWQNVEEFCRKNLGAEFDGPTPDLPPDQAYPTHAHPGDSAVSARRSPDNSAALPILATTEDTQALISDVLSVALSCDGHSICIYNETDVSIDVCIKNISNEDVGFPAEYVRKRGIPITLIDQQTGNEQLLPISPGRLDLINKFIVLKPGDVIKLNRTVSTSEIHTLRQNQVDLIAIIDPAAKIMVDGKPRAYSSANARIRIVDAAKLATATKNTEPIHKTTNDQACANHSAP